MDALKNASFLADNEGEEKESRNHYLDPISEEETTEITIMAFQHKHLPIWGVQFHPESVSTEHGSKMMNNFQLETYNWMMNQVPTNACVCVIKKLK